MKMKINKSPRSFLLSSSSFPLPLLSVFSLCCCPVSCCPLSSSQHVHARAADAGDGEWSAKRENGVLGRQRKRFLFSRRRPCQGDRGGGREKQKTNLVFLTLFLLFAGWILFSLFPPEPPLRAIRRARTCIYSRRCFSVRVAIIFYLFYCSLVDVSLSCASVLFCSFPNKNSLVVHFLYCFTIKSLSLSRRRRR